MTLEQAARLRSLGLNLIPLVPKGKRPDISEWEPFKTTLSTESQHAEWFGNGVRRNAGVVLGSVSGVVVIESDTPEAEAWCVANLPPTPMATRSARGIHRYYRMPSGVWESEPIPATIGPLNVEVKRQGQYVVAPGSVHETGHVYAEVETWPASLADVPEFPWDTVARSQLGHETTTHTPAEPLPATVNQGGRNTTLFREGCRLRRLGFSEREILAALLAVNAERCQPPLDQREVEVIAEGCAKYEPAEDTYPLTEAGDAEFFAQINGDHLRYDHRCKQWMVFDGHHWVSDADGVVSRMTLDAMRARHAAAIKLKDDAKRREHAKWAMGGEFRKRQLNLLALAQSIKPLADSGDDWDADPYTLGVKNGVVDLRSGQLRDGQPADRIKRVSPVAFDPEASTAKWSQFVLDVCSGNDEVAAYLQTVVGYVLTGLTGEQCFWILYGTGSNGKSTFLETLTREIIPAHSWSMPFPKQGWSESMSEYQRAELEGRCLVVAKENEQSQRLNTEFMKSLTGDESIAARHPYGRPFNFKPKAKFFLAVNHKPEIRDETHGMWRRVRLVPFEKTFTPNPAFAESLRLEGPGILRWAVEGAVRYFRDGLQTPDAVKVATDEYQQGSNPLAPFFETTCVIGKGCTKAGVLFDAYRRWCEANFIEDRISQVEFGQRLAADTRLVKQKNKSTNTWEYAGIALIQPAPATGPESVGEM